jgi:cyanophycinase
MNRTKAVFRRLLELALLPALAGCVSSRELRPGLRVFRLGNPSDSIQTTRFGEMLMGGGTDVDEAFRWMIDRSGGGDFLILRASGDDDYNTYVAGLARVNSVETLLVTSREAADSAEVADRLAHAEAIFLAGGDQSRYLAFWKGTAISRALDRASERGIPVGGTSAGLAVLSQFIYTGENASETSAEALADPYNQHVTLDRDFVSMPHLKNVLADTHFSERDRMGRSLVFLARLLKDGRAAHPRGIGVDARTALLVEPDGHARVVGSGAVFFIDPLSLPALCSAGHPLTMRDIAVIRVRAGGGFDLNSWEATGGVAYTLSAENGRLESSNGGVYGPPMIGEAR